MNNHYILRDKQEIFGIYNTLEEAYSVLLQFIYNFFRYSKILNDNNNNNIHVISHFQIISYSNNIINNIYNLNSSFKLQDYNLEPIIIKTLTLQDLINKIDLIIDDINFDSNDLNLFIPINFTETEKKNNNDNINDNHNINDNDNINDNIIEDTNIDISYNLEELKNKMLELENIKEIEKNKITSYINDFKKKEENYLIEKMKTERLKQTINNKHEKISKMKYKFNVDKQIYFEIKEEILNNNRSENNIPELFQNEYIIFKKLDNDNILNLNDSEYIFAEYLKNKPEIKQNFKSKYDEIFNNIKWNISDNESNSDTESETNSNNESNY